MPTNQEGKGGAGVRLNTTRKNLAFTGAKEIVCWGAPPSGSLTTSLKFCPSSLDSRDLSGLLMPLTATVLSSKSLAMIVMERSVCGAANSY